MLRLTLVLPLMALFQCDRDETVAAYGASDWSWVLREIDGQPFEASVILQFPEEGKIAGNAPCNSYNGTLNAPYPWFAIKDLAATRAACAALEAEGVYFAALLAMTQSEVSGDVLILRNEDGHEMVFKAAE
ncbi:META domain-containing protein [Ruegeria profundi]|uniref:META domain-containing protein n=1 Tax=Ruegeria profundi TaxID=1685378 RepID=UPI003C7A64EE